LIYAAYQSASGSDSRKFLVLLPRFGFLVSRDTFIQHLREALKSG
jgi:hypothetical protein